MGPLLRGLRATEGKESWKTRQEAVEALLQLVERKRVLVNNKAVGELLAALKLRLTEANLNLRAKVLLCIAAVARALGREVVSYTSLLLPELMKLCGETKQNVVDAL